MRALPFLALLLPSACVFSSTVVVGCTPQEPTATAAPAFTVSQADQDQGWIALFDGQDTGAFRGYRQKDFPAKGWTVQDSVLTCGPGGGDLITRRQFGDFELELQFRTAPKANSGILYRVTEDEDASYWTGPEFQVLDDQGHGLAADHPTSAGALYGLYPPTGKTLKPAGQWNDVRIVLRGGQVEHWLNGTRVVSAQLGSDDWNQKVGKSKFGRWKRFGQAARGHLCLQEHGDVVSFRHIRVRELPPAESRLGDEVVLFDGTNLDAWQAHLNDGGRLEDVWSIQEGVLVCKGKPTGYLYTKAPFTSYVLDVEWRFDPTKGAGNSGVLLRLNGEHKVWPRSIEAQLHSTHAGDFWNIGEMGMQTTDARRKGRNTKHTHPNEKPLGEWNHYRIVVDGPWVQLTVNGQVLNEAWDCEVLAGPIALQSEGAEIHFRRVALRPLR